MSAVEEREHSATIRGLRHHYLRRGGGPRTLLLLHGWLDLARLFDGLATRLAAALGPEWRILALDFRGHGDSAHVGPESAYQLHDYVADVHGFLAEIAPNEPVMLCGHSLGGMVGAQYAGAFPERVERFCMIEGLGPPKMSADIGPDRLRGYCEDVLRLGDLPRRRMASIEEAAERVLARHQKIHREDALHYARHQTRPLTAEERALAESGALRGEGDPSQALVWKFDPRLNARGPYPFLDELVLPFFARITAPVLYIEGSDGYTLDAETRARRLAPLRRLETLTVPGANHHVHLDAPDLVAERLATFLTRPL